MRISCDECGFLGFPNGKDPQDCVACVRTFAREPNGDEWESGGLEEFYVWMIRQAVPAWVEAEPDAEVASAARFAYTAKAFADFSGAAGEPSTRDLYRKAVEALRKMEDRDADAEERRRSAAKAERLFCKAETIIKMRK